MSTSLRMKCKVLVTSVFLAILLTGCATSPKYERQEPLPLIPPHLRTCFLEVTKLPGDRGSSWTREQAVGIIGELRASELEKTDCGRQLLAYIDDVAKGRR